MNEVFIIPFIICVIALLYDIKYKEIPDYLSLILLFISLTLVFMQKISLNYWLLGTLFYGIIGLVMYYLDYWGGGDSKILLGLGGFYGISSLASIVFFGCMASILLTWYFTIKKREVIGMPFFLAGTIFVLLIN